MKVRFGFVSNSSSSSFIIGVKNGLLFEDAFRQEFDSLFGIHEGGLSPDLVSHLEDSIIDIFLSQRDDCGLTIQNKENLNFLKEQKEVYSSDEEEVYMQYLFDHDKYAIQVSIPDGGDGGDRLSSAIRYLGNSLNYESDDLSIKCI